MQIRSTAALALFVSIMVVQAAFLHSQEQDASEHPGRAAVEALIERERAREVVSPHDAFFPPRARLLEIEDDPEAAGGIRLLFNSILGERGWHADEATELRTRLAAALDIDEGPEVKVRVGRGDQSYIVDLDDLITSRRAISERWSQRAENVFPTIAAPVVQREDYAGPPIEHGLAGRHIVVAGSHGITWHKENRWQWQRASLHTTVEDVFTSSYANPFFMPMLENAGAVVFAVRERDYQQAEVIVDNDGADPLSRFERRGPWTHGGRGWSGGVPDALDKQTEPFTLGTSLRAAIPDVESDEPTEHAEALYVPYIPRDGRYAVYTAWNASRQNSSSVPVRIRHAGGETTVRVNQQVAGGTWIYLGHFDFRMGADEEHGSVVISTEGAALHPLPPAADDEDEEPTRRTAFVSVDAVRFGGGMGNATPGGIASGLPRHAESARYWLQYSGAPRDMLFLRNTSVGHFGQEYTRDYVSRSEWPNYLIGRPFGPGGGYRQAPGLGVPIDAYISWHSDAGVNHDGIYGTLMIHSGRDSQGNLEYPDGRPRTLGRDLAVMFDRELVRMARQNYSSTWQRRDIRESGFAEARNPNVPALIIEMFSHQNLNDMKYGLDPRFKFDVSRAFYKALLRFVAWGEGVDPIIQPLPPTHVAARHESNGRVRITWRPQPDPLEPTADPTGYIVYRSADGRAFDNGTYFSGPEAVVEVPPGQSSYFKIAAANAGGQSFPSRIVGVRWAPGVEPMLIVDGFDRVAPPAVVENDLVAGFDRSIDPGVGWHYNYGLIGDVYDFNRASDWLNDRDTPGWGATGSLLAGTMELGNTFDHVARHGRILAQLGYAFDSVTADAFAEGAPGGEHALVNWVAGLQRTTPPPSGFNVSGMPDHMSDAFPVLTAPMRTRLAEHVERGGRLLLSGSYIAEDLLEGPLATDASRTFARDVLGIADYRSRATGINHVEIGAPFPGSSHSQLMEEADIPSMNVFRFGLDLEAELNPLEQVLRVHAPEAFEPAAGAEAVLTYADTERSAALSRGNVTVIGFPLETITPTREREDIFARLFEVIAPGMREE